MCITETVEYYTDCVTITCLGVYWGNCCVWNGLLCITDLVYKNLYYTSCYMLDVYCRKCNIGIIVWYRCWLQGRSNGCLQWWEDGPPPDHALFLPRSLRAPVGLCSIKSSSQTQIHWWRLQAQRFSMVHQLIFNHWYFYHFLAKKNRCFGKVSINLLCYCDVTKTFNFFVPI